MYYRSSLGQIQFQVLLGSVIVVRVQVQDPAQGPQGCLDAPWLKSSRVQVRVLLY
jgi:hypothetical protein